MVLKFQNYMEPFGGKKAHKQFLMLKNWNLVMTFSPLIPRTITKVAFERNFVLAGLIYLSCELYCGPSIISVTPDQKFVTPLACC